MIKNLLLTLLGLLATIDLLPQRVAPEDMLRYNENYSLTYEEAIEFYSILADIYPNARLMEVGMTDAGKPLHLFIISDDTTFNHDGKAVILISNGIHPGEPEGIDASAQFAYDILSGKDNMNSFLKNTVIAIIPVYNIGGALTRSPYYRIDQNGPEDKGVRRNSRFLDLNRDFVRQESREARSFAQIYRLLDPDVFLDTHTTNGSDHQFTVTLIATQPEKMYPEMQDYFRNRMLPALYENMKVRHCNEMIPYVQYVDRGAIKAIMGFDEASYFSTGYASLFNTFAFMTEILTYKPFPERVKGTYQFITELTRYTSENAEDILRLRADANKMTLGERTYVLDWEQDTTRWDKIIYRGYEWEETQAPISGRATGFYNHDKPYTDTIRYFNYFNPAITVRAPEAYIIPFAWEEVIKRLEINGVKMWQMENDTLLTVETYYIDSYEPAVRSSQGHYFNTNVSIHTVTQEIQYFKGDYVVPVNQKANRYIVHMLEPQDESGFFAWNFFDAFLEGQDWYSAWGFESHLKELLDTDPALRKAFEEARTKENTLATSPAAQLQWLYQNTPPYVLEKRRNLYPVGRLMILNTKE